MSPKELLISRFPTPLGVRCIEQVLNDEPIDDELAARLSRVYGNSKEFWLKAQAKYDSSKKT